MKSKKQIMTLFIAFGFCVVLLTGCGGGGGGGSSNANPVVPTPPQNQGTLKITNLVPKVIVKIDGSPILLSQDGSVLLSSGAHQLIAERSGYSLTNASEIQTVVIETGKTTEKTLQFKRKAPPMPPGWTGVSSKVIVAHN